MTLVATVGVIEILRTSAPVVNELSLTVAVVLTFAPEALCFV